LYGFNYNEVDYYYLRNTQGDITSIINRNGIEVARYTYDAWGNHVVNNLTEDNIGDINPFRYRGYYYDKETQLYYLNARYYDPEVGRFISQDNISYLAPETINGLNLYAYCGNNPVMLSDSTGMSPFWDWITGAANTVGNWFADHWVELAVGAAFIVVGALVTALTAGTGLGFMAAFGSALLTSMTQVGISVAISAGIGAIVGGITGGWEGALKGFGDGIASGFMWGGIFAGGAQILSGGFKMIAQLGANTSKTSFFQVLTPNRLRNGGEIAKIAKKGQTYYEYGGTLLKVGKNFIDISNKTFLHMHLWFTGSAHIPLGTILGGILGGF
jgi:RHS repeat-associated protein